LSVGEILQLAKFAGIFKIGNMSWRRSCLVGLGLIVGFFACAHGLAAEPVKPATRAAATQPVEEEAWCSRVTHSPQLPKTGQSVKMTASIAAGYSNIALRYQVVEPGDYIELHDPGYAKEWKDLPFHAGAVVKGRTVYSAEFPADLQKHRRLIRYRITAKDAAGKAILAPVIPATIATINSPATPEMQSNYAYFVYDGLPPWKGAIDPASKDPALAKPIEFSSETLAKVQPYHLLGKKTSIENVTWREQTGGKEYKYTGTLVVDGVAHDHVRFRARGGVWRFAMGKNMWKLDLPAADHLHAVDDFGRAYPVTWNKVNLQSIIQQGSYGRRGEQGLHEGVGYALFNLVGVEAPRTHYVQLRIIDEADESSADQYRGDFWGLYLAIENEDGRFLRDHGLPDGNIFKMAGGGGELNHQGIGQPADRSDLNAFLGAYSGREQSADWWRKNLDLPRYYSYRAILECIHHYDISDGKNYDYYFNPEAKKWQVIPWDLDLSWADHMYGGGEEPFKSRVLTKPELNLEYQNRLREIRDLLFNPEQTGALIDEHAAVINDPAAKTPQIVEADRRKWDYHPALAGGGQAGHGQYYRAAATKDFPGMVQLMKDYIKSRGAWVDANLLTDRKIPATPTATYTGPASHPAGHLTFRASAYNGTAAFAAVKWRIAEITPADIEAKSPRSPGVYEITPVWQSEEMKQTEEITIPANVTKAGHTYRVRVLMKDAMGRCSHWSAPVEFIGG